MRNNSNIDEKTVLGLGQEWGKFSYTNTSIEEIKSIADEYFSILDLSTLTKNSVVLDVGCGTGRWAQLIAPLVKTLYVIDPSSAALDVARQNLRQFTNVVFINSSINSFEPGIKFDLIYSLGVLHHVPDTEESIQKISELTKRKGNFLVYLYYRFDNRGKLYRTIWKLSDMIRVVVSTLPFKLRAMIAEIFALTVYLPLANCAKLFSWLGLRVDNFPLNYYKDKSYYVMRTDSLDRFGTKLEKRFTKLEITNMLSKSGFKDVIFSERAPHWVALGTKV